MQPLLICLLPLALTVSAVSPEPDQASIDRLIKQLGDPVFEKREQASKELTKMGKPALPSLRQAAVKHADAEVRKRATRAIDEIERADPVSGKPRERVQALIAQLDGPKFQEREAAMRELSMLDKDALPLLQAAQLANPSLELRRRLELIIQTIQKR